MRSFVDIFKANCEFSPDGKHVNGTDRQSNHYYGAAYDSMFPEVVREHTKLVLEVGCADGSGLLSFVEGFPNALIVGMDIHPISKQHERVEFNLGDQRVKEDCKRATKGRLFDVIIEDAYHSTENTLLTLFWLWPFVKPNGVYVIEEWHNIHGDWDNVRELLPTAKWVNTTGPSGGTEPLILVRKPQ